MLSDYDIQNALDKGDIEIFPMDHSQLQPASVDVRLSPDIRRLTLVPWGNVDVAHIPEYSEPWHGQQLVLKPHELVLGSTIEKVRLTDKYGAKFEGRSSLGRIGLMTHITAGFIDPGFTGNITLEILNVSPWEITLHAGMRIGQLCFFKLDSSSTRLYGSAGIGNYKGERAVGPVPAKGDIR